MEETRAGPIERGTVRSRDGVALSYRRLGQGKPLVVCHGSFSMAEEWLPFAEQLAASCTVLIYDRRGCGDSSCPSSAQPVDAEVDDLAAMVDFAGPDAAVLGHSFGGGCALSFAARGSFPGPLLLYEPRHSIRQPVSRGQIPAIERLVAAGDQGAAVEHVMRHVVGLPAEAIAHFRNSPQWQRMCASVRTFPNEVRLLDSLAWQPGDLDGIAGVPTLIVGETSPPVPSDTCWNAALRSLLPQLRVATIPGHGHFAYLTAPASLAALVDECMRSARS